MGFDIVARNEDEPVVENKSAEIEKLTSFNGGFLMQLISGVLGLAGQIIGGAVTAVVGGVKIIADGVKQLVGGIAKAIMGEGASHNEITGAVDERLGPLDTAITENANHFKELSDRADVLGEQQTETRKAAEAAVEKAEGSIKHTDSLIAKRVQAEKLIAADVAEANRKAGNAQKSADGKSTNHYGSGAPASPKDGDVWFKPVSGGTQIMVREAGKWVNRTDTAALDKALADNKKAVADAAKGVKQLRDVDLVKLRGSLASEAQERERALAGLGVELESANRELASLGTARPGNVWPDPHFKDPCWVGDSDRWVNPNNNGGELTFRANGKQIGMYYQPQGKHDKGLMLERGAKYLLTATVWRDKNLPDKTTISVHMRQNGKWVAVVGRLPTGPAGVSVESVILNIPTTIGGGGSTLGFFVERNVKQGAVSIWDVQIVRAADDAMIIDGAVTAAKVHAGAIDTKHLAADAVTAEKIKAGEVKAGKLAADAVLAGNIAANAITSREVSANSIFADHLVIGGPSNMIANGSFTEGKEPWHKDLQIRKIGKNQALPPGDSYAITKPGQTTLQAHTGYQWMTVSPNGMYAFEVWLYADKPGSRLFIDLGNQYGDHAGMALRDKVNSDDISSSSGSAYLVNNVEVKVGWNRYSTVYQMGKNTTRARLNNFFFNHPNGSEKNAQIAFAGISLRPMADADLIVDGSILAQHIKAGEITGDKLKADTITGREVKAGTINANQLKVDNGFIKTAMIGDGQITTAKIANLDAGKITTGTLDGKLIKADTITVNQLRAGTIVPIGGSLIHHEPTAKNPAKPEPIWWQVFEMTGSKVGYVESPEGNLWRRTMGSPQKDKDVAIPKRLVKVQPGQKYRLRLWAFATHVGSVMYLNLRNQDGELAVKSGAVYGSVKKAPSYKTATQAKLPWPVADFTGNKNGLSLLTAFEVPNEPTLITSTIEFKEGTEYVYLDNFVLNSGSGKVYNAYQWIAGLSLELDIPDQAAVDAAQNKAIEAVNEAAAANTKFNKQQEEINSLTQERLWQHQDMIELLDIRSPKTYGWDVYNNEYDTAIPWTSETQQEKYTPPHEWWQDEPDPQWRNVPLKGYRMTSPFFDMYHRGDRVWIGFKGDVQGMFDIEINWTNGAIDNWALPMQGAKSRVYRFYGGAGHIYMRSVQVTVYPTSLRRKVNLTLRNGAWRSPSDTNKLIRSQNAKFVRFKNGVKCNRSITLRSDGGVKRTYSPGTILWSEQFYAEDQPRSSSSVVYEFTEIDDVDVQYTVPNSAPSATDKTSNYFNARR